MTEFLKSVIRIVLVCVTVINIVHLQNWKIWAAAQEAVCRTPECQSLSQLYLNNMNKKVNPCVNFYEFACDGFGVQHGKPSYEDSWRTEALQEKSLILMRKLLESPKQSGVPQIEQAKFLHNACLRLPYMPKTNPQALKEIVRRVGNWPMFFPKNKELPADLHWWQIDNEYRHLTGDSALFEIALVANGKRNNHVIPYIYRLYSPNGMIRRTETWLRSTPARDHYKKFLNNVLKVVAPQRPPIIGSSVTKDLNDVLIFRDSLYQLIKGIDNNDATEMTIGEFQQWYNRHTKGKETAQINWLEVIRHMHKDYKDSYGVPIQAGMHIQVDTEYFTKFAILIGQTPKRVLVNHIHLYFAERRIILSPAMLSELKQCYVFRRGKVNGHIRHDVPRPYWCILNNSMKTVIKSLYADAGLPNRAKAEVVRLVEESRQQLKEEIQNSPWIDDETRTKAIGTVDAMSHSIGWVEHQQLSPVNSYPISVELDPLEPEAYYVIEMKRLFMSTAYLQPPIYCPNCPYVIDYGATVSTIAHELQHAFEPIVTQYTDLGSSVIWSPKIRPQLQKRTQCFRDQYNHYKSAYLKKYKITDKASLPNTLYEDVSDVIGLKIAYKRYKKKLQQNKGVCPVIPGFLGTPCDKLFFIAFANTLCDAVSPDGERLMLQSDPHSLPQIRINGAVANMEEFSTAFGCKPNDPLNREDRCDIWSA